MQEQKKLEIIDLCKEYRGEDTVIKNISFDVFDGEFLSILGSSGCGKTTILRMLIGVLAPTSGKIIKDGRDITNAHPSGRGMGIVFQNYALFENMTVFMNVAYALKIRKIKDYKEQAEDMLRRLGLEDIKDKKPVELSGGQQQRVAIARTMALKPDIILFDEPLSALDVSTRLLLRNEIKALQKESGVTMIYVTHDQEEAFAMSDRIMVMRDGKIEQIASPEELVEKPANEFVKEFVVDNLQMKIDALAKYRRNQ
ncbi:MAG: ABC transporter ATP-binding protein [Oscillospiraceae bacterium]|nr:ABC transporter ATP-binding protein [Oscillospiraceae bacterium]